MSTPDTLWRSSPSAGHRGMIVAGRTIPTWVNRWCASRDRNVCTRPLDAVTAASVSGDSVLVLREHGMPVDRPRIVAAVRALPDDAAVVAEAAEATALLRGSLLVLHGVPLSFGERTIGLSEALRRGQLLLTEAEDLAHRDGPIAVDTALVRAWPHELVGERLDADLLVIGGPRTARAGGIGLVAATAVQHAPCAVILAPRPASPDERNHRSSIGTYVGPAARSNGPEDPAAHCDV